MDRAVQKANYVRHISCDKCGSSDANAEYDDGSTYCFSCETYQAPEPDGDTTAAQTQPTAHQTEQTGLLEGQVQAISARQLTEETCHKFGYLASTYQGEPVQVAVYRNKSGIPVAQKLRTKDKQFKLLGSANDMTLFGSHLWNKGKKLTICEGEIDAMTVSQVQNHKWATVSLPNGAQSAAKAIKANWDYINGFEEVILMFDMDEAGQKAAQTVAELLPVGKAKIASLPCKDANDCLIKGKSGAIIEAIFQARDYRPDGIVAATDYREAISIDEAASSITYPYSMLNDILLGMRKGELVTVTAGSGIGKSTFIRELTYHLHSAGQRVGCIMLEESNKRTLLGLVGIHLSKNITVDRSLATDDEIVEAFDDLFSSDGRHPVYLYDHFGSTDVDLICNRIVYMAKALEVDWVVLDHISILISGMAVGDERKLIDMAMTKMRTLVQEHNIGLILVSHLRRPDGDRGHENGAAVRLGQLRGSHAIAQLSDACIAMEVDADAPDSDIRHFRVLKNRFTGQTGEAGTVRYDRETGRLLEEQLAHLLEGEEEHDDQNDG